MRIEYIRSDGMCLVVPHQGFYRIQKSVTGSTISIPPFYCIFCISAFLLLNAFKPHSLLTVTCLIIANDVKNEATNCAAI